MRRLLAFAFALCVAVPACARQAFSLDEASLDALVEELTPLVEAHSGGVFASTPEVRLVDESKFETARRRAAWRDLVHVVEAGDAFVAARRVPQEPTDTQREALRRLGALQYMRAKEALGEEAFELAVVKGDWPALCAAAEDKSEAFAGHRDRLAVADHYPFVSYVPSERAVLLNAGRFDAFASGIDAEARDLARAGLAHELARAMQDEQLDLLVLADRQRTPWMHASMRRVCGAHAMLVEALVSNSLGLGETQAVLASELMETREPLQALAAGLFRVRDESGDARVWSVVNHPPLYACELADLTAYNRTHEIADHRETIRRMYFDMLEGSVKILPSQFRDPMFLADLVPEPAVRSATFASSRIVDDAVLASVRGDGASFLLSATSFHDTGSATLAYHLLRESTLARAPGVPAQFGTETTDSDRSEGVVSGADGSSRIVVTSSSADFDLRTTAIAFRKGNFVGTLTATEPAEAVLMADAFATALMRLAESLPCNGGQ